MDVMSLPSRYLFIDSMNHTWLKTAGKAPKVLLNCLAAPLLVKLRLRLVMGAASLMKSLSIMMCVLWKSGMER